MREYIDKGDAIFAVSALPLTLDAETTQRAIEAVRAVPAADVVEVVRCKDCKWYEKIIYTCLQNDGMMPGEGFCSFGERKEVQG